MASTTLDTAARPLVDSFGRRVSYLRISVTDRCDLRCRYCMSEEMQFLPRQEVLSFEEIERIAGAFVARGVTKLRLTGGEPLVRRGIVELVQNLGRHLGRGLDELTLTTNGNQLEKHAAALADAGIRRINVSLDTLDAAAFRHITRWGDLDRVLAGIDAAKRAGLHVKINTVALNGINDAEFPRLVDWCAAAGHDLVFIETMPLGEIDDNRSDHYLSLEAVKATLAARYTLRSIDDTTGGPARYFRVAGTGQRIGFITPLSHNFCESCNRVRLTATGVLYMCLGQDHCVDLRAAVRNADPDAALDAALDRAMLAKPRGHDFVIARGSGAAVARHMNVTGG
jgi:cyclic pyranopterin phosphate synthase